MKRTTAIPGFRQRVRKLMDERGLTFAELARRSGRSTGTVVKIVYGSRNPSLGVAVDFATALGVTLDMLLPPELRPRRVGRRRKAKN